MKHHVQPYRENPGLRISYSLLAPFYDVAAAFAFKAARALSLQSLNAEVAGKVLLSGIGTGLDLPILPKLHRYTALDFNAAMMSIARPRVGSLNVDWVLGDSMALPFPDAHFDHVVLHLIVSIVPQPALCLSEAARVLKPGGTIILMDKFLPQNKFSLLLRAINPLTRRIVTRTDVVFDELMRAVPQLQVISNVPLLAGGWIRGIVLRKR